jgi:hypothetical protein
MSISVLDTYAVPGGQVDEERLPCRRENPELFFAETPQDVEVAKALCQAARCAPSVWPEPSRGGSPGECGAVSCSCKERSSPASGPVADPGRTRWPPDSPAVPINTQLETNPTNPPR